MPFTDAFNYTIGNEGHQFTNDPDDPGGPTKYGITLKVLTEYFATHDKGIVPTAADVEALDLTEAAIIYQKMYWDALGLDGVTEPAKATAIFDMSVNCGKTGCTLLVQQALGIQADGAMGDLTRSTVNKIARVDFFFQFIKAIIDHYVAQVVKHPERIKYFHGWCDRAARLILLMN